VTTEDIRPPVVRGAIREMVAMTNRRFFVVAMEIITVGIFCETCYGTMAPAQFSEWIQDRQVGIIGEAKCDGCRQPRPLHYERRNRFLKVLGFNSYRHYLNSEMWKTIRMMVLARDEYKCTVASCDSRACDVHHNSYEMNVLIGKDLRQLVSLCRKHHREAEFTESNKKRKLEDVRSVLKSAGVPVFKLTKKTPTPLRKDLPPGSDDSALRRMKKRRRYLIRQIYDLESAPRIPMILFTIEARKRRLASIERGIIQHFGDHLEEVDLGREASMIYRRGRISRIANKSMLKRHH
jgi:hypothetical protein